MMGKRISGLVMIVLWLAGSVWGESKMPKFGKVSYAYQVKHSGTIRETMQMVFQWNGKRFRQENRIKNRGDETWIIGNGNKVYTYDAKTKKAEVMRQKMTTESFYPGAPRGFSLQKVGEEKLKGYPCEIYEGKSPGERPGRTRAWLTKKEGLLIKAETAGPHGSMVQTLKSLDLKTPPRDSAFRLPSGVKAQ